jgi:non-canonical (house-cleaning) NTP pyrophosphatase
LAVNRDAWDVLRKSGSKPAGTSDTARLRSNRVNVAKDDVVNSVGVDTGALDEGFDAVSTNICGVDL